MRSDTVWTDGSTEVNNLSLAPYRVRLTEIKGFVDVPSSKIFIELSYKNICVPMRRQLTTVMVSAEVWLVASAADVKTRAGR